MINQLKQQLTQLCEQEEKAKSDLDRIKKEKKILEKAILDYSKLPDATND